MLCSKYLTKRLKLEMGITIATIMLSEFSMKVYIYKYSKKTVCEYAKYVFE